MKRLDSSAAALQVSTDVQDQAGGQLRRSCVSFIQTEMGGILQGVGFQHISNLASSCPRSSPGNCGLPPSYLPPADGATPSLHELRWSSPCGLSHTGFG
jgi:hypothetical protein